MHSNKIVKFVRLPRKNMSAIVNLAMSCIVINTQVSNFGLSYQTCIRNNMKDDQVMAVSLPNCAEKDFSTFEGFVIRFQRKHQRKYHDFMMSNIVVEFQ